MGGIKELVGLLFWMDNTALPAMKAVQRGERALPKNKIDILQHLQGQHSINGNGRKRKNGHPPSFLENGSPGFPPAAE